MKIGNKMVLEAGLFISGDYSEALVNVRVAVAQRLEHLPTVRKIAVRDPLRANGWTLTHCPPSSEWDLVETLGSKGGVGMNWPPSLTKPMTHAKFPI